MRRSVLLVASTAVAMLIVGGVSLVAIKKPAQAAFPGRDGAIAYVNDALIPHVFRINTDGTGRKQLAGGVGGEGELDPTWSPDGTRMALHAYSSPFAPGDIWLVGANGENLTNLTNTPEEHEGSPAWFPSGKKIVFSKRIPPEAPPWTYEQDLYAMSLDARDNVTNTTAKLTTGPPNDLFPAVSPDGQKIAFVSDLRDGDGDYEVYMMDANVPEGPDNRPVKLAEGTVKLSPYNKGGPDWSPDGERIAFGTDRDGNGEIYVMDADGTNQTNITNSPSHEEFSPAFSPTGKRIAFARDRDVWIMDADGSDQTNVSNNDHPLVHSYSPDWQPLPTPKNKAECKKGGYNDFGFKNRGECTKYVEKAT